ncbi:MAG: YetF domain-containing protein, partial [Alphaproteobacteria bacterium]
KHRMARARIGVEDVLEAARFTRGLERLDQIKYAVLEVSGGISIIPKEPEPSRSSLPGSG